MQKQINGRDNQRKNKYNSREILRLECNKNAIRKWKKEILIELEVDVAIIVVVVVLVVFCSWSSYHSVNDHIRTRITLHNEHSRIYEAKNTDLHHIFAGN